MIIREKKVVPTKKQNLNMAGEYAVASEICRRNYFAQITLGRWKRTDILVYNPETERELRVEVKAKQKNDWPNCKGIFGENVVLVFVDFQNKEPSERPDFYILTGDDWVEFVKGEIPKYPDTEIKMDEKNCPIWTNQITKSGKPYEGMGVKPNQISSHKERWDKIDDLLT